MTEEQKIMLARLSDKIMQKAHKSHQSGLRSQMIDPDRARRDFTIALTLTEVAASIEELLGSEQ